MLINYFFQNFLRYKHIKCFCQSLKIPLDYFRLTSVTVSFILIRGVRNIILTEVVNEAKWSIVKGNTNHTHVVCVKDTMNETNRLPIGNKLCWFNDQFREKLFIWVSLLFINLFVNILQQIVSQSGKSLSVFHMIRREHISLWVSNLETSKTNKRFCNSKNNSCILFFNNSIVHRISNYLFFSNNKAQCPGGGYSETFHKFRREEFSDCRADNTVAICMSGERAQSTSFQLEFIYMISL